MSTKVTTSPRGQHPLVDSRSLKLTRLVGEFQNRMVSWLLGRLHRDGFELLTANQLAFLGELDCGINHASELARRLGVSRQAIHKSVVELDRLGWLETEPHPEYGNQKVILFTDEGERMMSRARLHFAELDAVLLDRFGLAVLDSFEDVLATPGF